jgi:hypothetical protein
MMTRLQDWINEEIAAYENLYGRMDDDQRTRFTEHLAGTLNGAQLHVADEAGVLGNTVLAALRDHSDRLRDSQLARWFRSSR